MSVDKRGDILARVKAIYATVPGIAQVYSNRGDVDQMNLPALVLLDGNEIRRTAVGPRNFMSMQVMVLQPQTFLVLKPKTRVADQELLTAEMSDWRTKILGKLATDRLLPGLLGDDGFIEYLGYTTDLQTGSEMKGSMQFTIHFGYLFDPADL